MNRASRRTRLLSEARDVRCENAPSTLIEVARRGSRIVVVHREEPMPLPPRDFSRIGPSEGDRFPYIRLPDQTGTMIDLHAARTARPAVVVFHRSAEW